MKDSVDRICHDGYSTILLELAQKLNLKSASPFVNQAQPLSTVNIVNASMINVPHSLNMLVVKEDRDIFDLSEALEVVVVNPGSCNHPGLTLCNWDVCVKLKELRIGDGCMQNVLAFELKSMKQLERVEIGNSCFTKTKGRMEVSGCMKLKSVKIGKESCVKWKEVVMRQCGVQEVEIGDNCFADCENVLFESEDDEW